MKPHMRILLGCATALLLTGAGSDRAFAYDVSVKNTTTEKVNIILYTRSDYSWDKYPTALSNTKAVEKGTVYTFSVPVDSRHACPSYLGGYNADFTRSIAMMGCDGVEVDNSTSRCCVNSNFEVYKKSDGSLHFRIK